MLRKFGIGTGYEHAAICEMGERVPDLLPVDDPLVAIAYGPRREPGEVGARARLGEELAPDLLAREHRSQGSVAEIVAAVRDHGRTGE